MKVDRKKATRGKAFFLRLWLAIFVALLCSLFISCASRQTSRDATTNSPQITVAAAANLTEAFAELGERFTAQTGVRVVYNFGATADLAKQIENGAPFDVFAAADVQHVDELNSQGLLTPGTTNIYALGRLVLWVPPESTLTLSRLEDVTRAEVGRIAVAKPDLAPYGRATIEALRALNLWPQVETKIVYGQNVSQAKQYAATGNADVAFIPLALVKKNEGRYLEVEERLHQPIKQAIAVIKDSPQQPAARSFVSFVLSPEGQALLESYGYKRP